MPGSAIGPRWGHGMAYDSGRDRVVLYGGRNVLPTPFSDTWEWDGATWTLRDASSPPPARSGAGMVHDSERDRVVLFGGRYAPRFRRRVSRDRGQVGEGGEGLGRG